MKEMGLKGFSHNEQSVRVVSLLESPPNITPLKKGEEIPEWPNSVGLNLTYAIQEGIFKHTDRFKDDCKDKELQKKFGKSCGSIEAQIVHIADDIAQNTHDLHDVWMAGAISREEVLTICSEYPQFFGESLFNRGTKVEISPLIGKSIFDVVDNSLKNLNNNYVDDPRKDRFIITIPEKGGGLIRSS
jgi:hypothetical protein